MLGKVRRKGLGTPFLEEDAKGPEGAACPVYTVRRVNNGALITFQAMAGDRMLGYIETFRESEALTAGMIRVVRRLKRCGVGTKLYEAAATWGCAKGLMLTSDRLRSAYSDGFWQKQVRKGRATCVKATPSGWRQTQPDPQLAVDGRSNCVHYKLKNCEVATDLSGSKKPRPVRPRADRRRRGRRRICRDVCDRRVQRRRLPPRTAPSSSGT